MIESILGRGLIYAGHTQLASDLKIEQTGKLQLTIHPGALTYTDGMKYELAQTEVIDFEANPFFEIQVWVWLGLFAGKPEVAVYIKTRLEFDFDEIENFTRIQELVWPFRIPAGATELPDLNVLEVRPGFPDGTTPEDWGM